MCSLTCFASVLKLRCEYQFVFSCVFYCSIAPIINKPVGVFSEWIYPVCCVYALLGVVMQVDVLFQLDELFSRVIIPSKLLLDQVSNAFSQGVFFHIFAL